jgi:hypothetical protein
MGRRIFAKHQGFPVMTHPARQSSTEVVRAARRNAGAEAAEAPLRRGL